ncbi:hypothetical protein Ddc_19476 [Ditylenchus destructor]|nr:hypothetical protein Ddc_19476 [Ditylenchus destructor]
MNNRKFSRQVAKRRRVNSSSAVQNPTLPRKKVEIMDDIWLEALKHLTCSQWSLMSLVSRQVNGVIQRNLSRLPPLLMESAHSNWFFSFRPRLEHVQSSMARSLQLLFHPIVYFKEVTIDSAHQKLRDFISNEEDRYIRCQSFSLNTRGDTPGKRPNITVMSESLKWLEQNVRSDSISLPKWVSYRVHETVGARATLSNFIFRASQKCKVQNVIFAYCEHPVVFLNGLIEDFFALPVVQDAIPTVVIDYYPFEEKYRAHLGENLIDREVDSQRADALYVIEIGEKRVRISFCSVNTYLNGEYQAYVKFYTI